MHRLTVKTRRKREILDITNRVQAWLSNQYGAQSGACQLVVLHTTAALTTADLDPGTDEDMLDAFERIILSALIGATVGILVENGSLVLGTWQRVILVELDGPRNREIAVAFLPGV
jgi:thiamine phosphate synthase YjbQ (UPF0047 family)